MKIVVFQAGDQLYGVAAATIEEIIDPVPVTPLPFVSPEVEGLINAAGRIYLQLSLERRLNREDVSGPDGGAVIMFTTGRGHCACRVTRTIARIDVEVAAVFPPPAEYGNDMAVTGLFYRDGLPVLLLEPEHLLLPQKCKDVVDSPCPVPVSGGAGDSLPQPDAVQDTGFPSVVCTCGTELFAFRFDDVIEVAASEDLTPLPDTGPEGTTVALWRGMPLPLLDICPLLVGEGVRTVPFTLVVRIGDRLAGLQVEQIFGIKRVTSASHCPPTVGQELLEAGVVAQDGAPVTLINRAALAASAYADPLHIWFRSNREKLAGSVARKPPAAIKKRMVLFRLGEELMALPLEAVERIEEFFEATETPGGESRAIRGVIQVRGTIMPVRSIERRLGIACDRQPVAYLIVAGAGSFCAVPVGKVERVVDIEVSALIPADPDRNGVVSGTGQYDGMPVTCIDGERLAA